MLLTGGRMRGAGGCKKGGVGKDDDGGRHAAAGEWVREEGATLNGGQSRRRG
jgi:hypothetical protein